MTREEILDELRSLGDEKVCRHASRAGAGDRQLGVKLGDLRKLAKRIGTDHELALSLWETGILDARLLAILVLRPKSLSVDAMDRLVRTIDCDQLADWFNAYVVKKHPKNEELRGIWMEADDPMAARAGWSLTAGRVARSPAGLDLDALLDRIESEMGGAHPAPRWTMNSTLAAIGIHHPAHRERAVAIGEALGVYRDYPVSKGCTSPFAPVWIAEMVRRQG